MKKKTVLGLVIGVFLLAIPSLAQQKSSSYDWPQFRGPNGSGVGQTTGLPSEFGPDKNVIWKKTIP
ncbi:MAG: serine/threonine protein kinase, partial [Candidatus Aminicenantes bacterium]